MNLICGGSTKNYGLEKKRRIPIVLLLLLLFTLNVEEDLLADGGRYGVVGDALELAGRVLVYVNVEGLEAAILVDLLGLAVLVLVPLDRWLRLAVDLARERGIRRLVDVDAIDRILGEEAWRHHHVQVDVLGAHGVRLTHVEARVALVRLVDSQAPARTHVRHALAAYAVIGGDVVAVERQHLALGHPQPHDLVVLAHALVLHLAVELYTLAGGRRHIVTLQLGKVAAHAAAAATTRTVRQIGRHR